jgi:transcriptional regulator with XRE-family HTH domain
VLPKALGRRIKQLREMRRWTQQQLAEKVEVESSGHISRWERGAVFPSHENLVALAKAFSIRMRDLFTFPEHPEI